jgi:hypothetical protein
VLRQDPVSHLAELRQREPGEVEAVDIDGCLDLVRRAAPCMLENLERRPPRVRPTRFEVLAKDGDCFRDELLEGDRPSLVCRRLPPPADGEDDPDPDDVARAGRWWFL